MRKLLTLGFLLGLVLFATASTKAQADPLPLPPMGMNITTPSYYDSMIYFNDVTRHGSSWISHDPDNPSVWDDERPISLTENGYPASLSDDQAARQIIFLESEIAPRGDYTLTWAGSGELGLEIDFSEQVIFDDESVPRQTVNIDPDETQLHLFIVIYSTDPTNPIRDIRLYLPGTDETSPRFTPWLLRHLQPFDVIRFMDWNWTNYTTVSTWDERSQRDWYSWGAEADNHIGVPYEVQIELANTVGVDMWVNVPHLADDNHVRELARLIQDQLHDDLRVWVEYSNEAWNPIFPVFDYLVMEAERVSATENLEDHYVYHQYGRRSSDIMMVFDEVFGENSSRVVGVVAGQAGWAPPVAFSLDAIEARDALAYFDVLALAPYFGDAWESEVGNVNTLALEFYADGVYSAAEFDQLFTTISGNIDAMFMGTDEYGQQMQANRQAATAAGLQIVAYEAGQSLTAGYFGNGLPEGIYLDVHAHPRMYDLYIQYLDGWRAFGGETLVMFHLGGFWNGSESFGHMENAFQPLEKAHKYRALLDWLSSRQ